MEDTSSIFGATTGVQISDSTFRLLGGTVYGNNAGTRSNESSLIVRGNSTATYGRERHPLTNSGGTISSTITERGIQQ